MSEPLSAYELQRLENIKQNHAKLHALGLSTATEELRCVVDAKKGKIPRRRKVEKQPPELREKSTRLANRYVVPDYTDCADELERCERMLVKKQKTNKPPKLKVVSQTQASFPAGPQTFNFPFPEDEGLLLPEVPHAYCIQMNQHRYKHKTHKERATCPHCGLFGPVKTKNGTQIARHEMPTTHRICPTFGKKLW